MPTLASKRGDAVSVQVDNAGAEETIAIWALRAGRLEDAFVALDRAERQLRAARDEIGRRIVAADQEEGRRLRRERGRRR